MIIISQTFKELDRLNIKRSENSILLETKARCNVFQACVRLRVFLSKFPFYHESVVYILRQEFTKFERKWPQFLFFNYKISRLFCENAKKLRIHTCLEHPGGERFNQGRAHLLFIVSLRVRMSIFNKKSSWRVPGKL